MFPLELSQQAKSTPVETLHRIVGAVGLVITVQGSGDLGRIVGDLVTVAPRLAEDHEVRADGLIVSRVGLYRVFWGALRWPGGSLAILAPLSLHDRQEVSEWTRHFMREVLDPIRTLSQQGYSVGGGGNGMVTEEGFSRAFQQAYV
ncbi:hypothetical protein ABT344_22900 [Micromonospora carbonacea]|jgi:hypothetical protein|uniref:hypothetical protein n=1 Tax=Micromonospora carbonacea TaxID=47853 RepID=UPI0033242265